MIEKRDILVLIGTKAQFIKTAPVLSAMRAAGLPCRLIYTGQHSETFDMLERAFGTGCADDTMVPNFEADTKRSFLRWTLLFWRAAFSRIRSTTWRAAKVGIVHGDTASTLFSAAALRMARIPVAHIEAGLRSPRLLEPFPEEIVRRLVSRFSGFHFAPDAAAVANLSRAQGRVIDTQGNTMRDALVLALASLQQSTTGGLGGYAIVSIHRSENLGRRGDFDLILEEVENTSRHLPVKFVLHPVTRERLRTTHWHERLASNPSIELMERLNYPDFVELMIGSRFLVTDGGSNQEEAAMLGLPALIMRRTTERSDGVGDNAELSNLDRTTIRSFVKRHADAFWVPKEVVGPSPSAIIATTIAGI